MLIRECPYRRDRGRPAIRLKRGIRKSEKDLNEGRLT